MIFTVDATAVPPIYNQDDAQRVNGVTLGVAGRITRAAGTSLANFAYLDTRTESQNAANDGKRLTLTPEFSGSVWTTVPTAVEAARWAAACASPTTVFINAANTIEAPGYHDRRRAWSNTR